MHVSSLVATSLFVFAAVGCGNSDSGATGGAAADGGGSDVAPPASCKLVDDTGGPGQYADGCVDRAWIAAYAGSYASATCKLKIAVDGAAPATFTLEVLSGAKAGAYVVDWEGGSGAGNDSYYRFTTDATLATTKTLNFNAGQAMGASDERNIGFRVSGLDTSTLTYAATWSETVAGAMAEVDCGALTKP